MKRLLALIIITLLLLIAARGWWNLQLAPLSSDKQEKTIIIAKGASINEIAQKLKEEDLIRSTLIFKLLIKQKGLGDKLQSGTFKLSPSLSADQILTALIGESIEEWVTLIEGLRIEEMADQLNSKFKINYLPSAEQKSKFLELSKEGYLFPDTYLFPREITVEQIVKIMRDNFEKKYSDELRLKIRAKGLSEEEGVILASIVEREARSDEARKMAASILLKRLKLSMGFNADATVQYALGYQQDEKSWWKRHLSKEDLKIDSPYNTYLYQGFPPTPICNPGLASLRAVAEADPNTPYLYYYHSSKGKAHYAKTLDEHNQNVANNP